MGIMEKLQSDKIEINCNKNPIKMSLFLSFLTISVEKMTDNLGYGNGWTEYENNNINLIISGGIVNGIEYLDSIQLGVKLANLYNNWVNPFYLFDIMTSEGQSFFIKYYENDIKNIIINDEEKLVSLHKELQDAEEIYKKHKKEMLEYFEKIKM